MLKRNRYHHQAERGSLLAGAFLVSTALAVALVALLSYSHSATRQAESLLSRSQLARMTQEKLTRDLLALKKNVDLTSFDASPSQFDGGEAQSSLRPVPENVKMLSSCVYLVVVATITNIAATSPRHMSLETILEITSLASASPAPVLPPPAPLKGIPVSKVIEDQLRSLIPEDEAQIKDLKKQILATLQAQFGSDVESLPISIEMTQYRDSGDVEISARKEQEKEGAFYMNPVSVGPPKISPRIRLWKEKYY